MTRKAQFFKPMPVISSHSRQVCLGSLQLTNAPRHTESSGTPRRTFPGATGKSPLFHHTPSGFGPSPNDSSDPPLETVTPGRHLSRKEGEYHRSKFLQAAALPLPWVLEKTDPLSQILSLLIYPMRSEALPFPSHPALCNTVTI